ncbi:MAG: class I SAM-dependent methyltransferase [Thermoplasmata archaeon]|nr:class I SAM-dependent methyltransferase [Thermoplasmata archaeon]
MRPGTHSSPRPDEAELVSASSTSIRATPNTRIRVDHCPACGSAARDTVCSSPDPLNVEAPPFTLVRCEACGVGSVAEVPPPRELRAYYPLDYGAYTAGSSLSSRVLTRIIGLSQPGEIGSPLGLPLFRPQPGARNLLDVGIGGGALAMQLHRRGWRVFGLDFTSSLTAPDARDEIGFVLGNAARTPYRDSAFDVLVASHVLEHMYNPLAALKEYVRLLRPGGTLVIGVPNFDSFPSRAFGRATYSFLDIPRHLVFFNPPALRRIIEDAGLGVAGMRTVPFPALLPTVLLKLGVPPTLLDHGPLRAVVSSLSLPLDGITQRGSLGCNLVAVATKR